ncbi:Carotenogenesis protein CarS [Myxococcaceae bacterium GXIMD 01537]
MNQDSSLIFDVDVAGAPVRLGAVVKLVSASADGTIDRRFLGRAGVVVALVYDDPATQYPADPLIQVRVAGLGEDLFFARELERVPAPETASPPLQSPPGPERVIDTHQSRGGTHAEHGTGMAG